MERPAFWKVPRDLHEYQLSEGRSESRPSDQSAAAPSTAEHSAQDKPALAALASYSIGFANLGLKGTPLTAASGPGATPSTTPEEPAAPNAVLDKPALSALACHAFGFAEVGLKVQPGSPAEGVVQRGDLVRKISDYDSRDIRHQDVQTLFKNAGPAIKLVVSRECRGGGGGQSAPGSRASSVPPVLPSPPSVRGSDSPYIMASLNPALIDHPRQQTASPHRVEIEEEMHMVTDQCLHMTAQPAVRNMAFVDFQPYRTTPLVLPGAKVKKDALPTESYLRHHPNPLMRAPPPLHSMPHEVLMKQKVADTVLQRVVGDDPNKKVIPQFNSPIGLYSEDNIVNTIVQQTGATPYKKTVVYDPAKSETYKALKESEFGDTLQEIPTPVEPKVFSPAKVNTKTTPHRSGAAHSVPGPVHNINSVGTSAENIQQSNTFKRLMHMVLEEENY